LILTIYSIGGHLFWWGLVIPQNPGARISEAFRLQLRLLDEHVPEPLGTQLWSGGPWIDVLYYVSKVAAKLVGED